MTRALEIESLEHGLPGRIRVDTGPEYISKELAAYCNERGVKLDFIKPGKPQQKAMSKGSIVRSEKMFYTPIGS